MKELELLDLAKCSTVAEIVDAMSRCSFGARMLGETANTLTTWIASGHPPLCIYDGRSDTPLGLLLQTMIRRKWLLGMMTPREYEATIAPGGRLLVVGAFSERHEKALFERPEAAIYINAYDLAKPGQVRDGWYPDAVFSDPRFVMPVLNHVLEDRLGTRVSGMAYPFGKPRRHFTRETQQIVAEAGYSYALAVCLRAVRSSDSVFQLPRIVAAGESVEELEEKVYGGWDMVGLWHERAPLWVAKMVSPSDFIDFGTVSGAGSNGLGVS